MYKITRFGTLVRLSDGAVIPFDESNTDYSTYVAWKDAGGEVEGDLPTLDELKAEKFQAINANAQAVANMLTTGYPDFEMKTWHQQEAEAMAWSVDPEAATPMIDMMAAIRGIDRALFLEKTLAKVTLFRMASAKLVGLRQKYEDQLNAAATAEEVQAIEPVYTLE